MCGIAGIFERGGRPVRRDDINGMLAAMIHRGPDGAATWNDGALALGHTRLKILDLSDRAAQPMSTADDQGVLVYNGLVYNYRDLRRRLVGEGVSFASSGDTEVVLQALHRWGPEAAIPQFNGMFAFAYFDRREGALWLARDRAGIKPLVIADQGGRLVFASEAKAILSSPLVEAAIDERAMTLYLMWETKTSGRTGFSGLRELPAGTWRKMTSSDDIETRYFHVLDNVDPARIAEAMTGNADGLAASAAGALKASVNAHLASDVPVAAMCSGGVDSSLIAAYASDRTPNLSTYVADVQGPESEAAAAGRVAAHLGLALHPVPFDRARFLRTWPLAVWHSDCPIYHASDPALMAVVRRCRDDGVRVLVTGEGSDELFGGYPRYAKTYRVWRRLDRMRRLGLPKPLWRSLARRLNAMPFRGAPAVWERQFQMRMKAARDANIETLPDRLMAKLSAVEPVADRAFLAHCLFEFHYYLAWILHRHDRIGMSASVEMRVPFLENDMIDLAFHLPRKAKLNGGCAKWAVKKAAELRLPSDIVYAPKKGFPVPEFYSSGSERLLLGGMLAEQFEWTGAATKDIVAMASTADEIRFRLVSLELWLRIFFGNADPAELGERLMAIADGPSARDGSC